MDEQQANALAEDVEVKSLLGRGLGDNLDRLREGRKKDAGSHGDPVPWGRGSTPIGPDQPLARLKPAVQPAE